jgi:hypothetical protein
LRRMLQVCDICGDPFEQFWDQEAEEWHLRDAISVDKKVGAHAIDRTNLHTKLASQL